MKTSQVALKLDQVSLSLKASQRDLFHKLSLTVYEGDFITLVGANGSGKSSLLKLINGSYKASQGCLEFMGEDRGTSYGKKHQSLATISQDMDATTFGELSVLENLHLAACSELFLKQKNKQVLKKLLAQYNQNLPDKLHMEVRDLSGGERQSLALCMMLLRETRILLLDEHTSALDTKTEEQLMLELSCHIKKNSLTALMVTHNLDHALSFGNRLLVLRDGKIVGDFKGEQKNNLKKQELLTLMF